MSRWAKFAFLLGALSISLFAASFEIPSANLQQGNPAASPETNEISAPDLVVRGEVVGRPVKPQPGEICLICKLPVDGEELAYLVEGQRIAVHRADCLSVLQSDARKWLAQLKTRGAFLGAVPAHSPPSNAVFFAGLLVLLGLIFGALSAHRAFHAGYSALAWFGLGFFLSVAAYFFLLSRPRREVAAPAGVPKGLRKIASTFSPEACPNCGGANHPSASTCGGCGAKLQPHVRSEVEKAGLKTA
ncbi:MAG: zinc ribbon domain-containing protein [Acidobacteria bacterium]|nr:zinc ribbon domain-containing protein [Acidobacteriota bacterium]